MKSHDTTTLWFWHFSIARKSILLPAGWLLLRHWLLLQGGINWTQQGWTSSTAEGHHWSICRLRTLQTLPSSWHPPSGTRGWVKPIQTRGRSFPRRGRNILQRRDFNPITNCLEPRKQKSSSKKHSNKKRVLQHLSKSNQNDPEKALYPENDRDLWLLRSWGIRIHQIHRGTEKTLHRS